MKLFLYYTLGCHLCDLAELELAPYLEVNPSISVEKIDISDSESLVEIYGVRIPVLKVADSELDLGWPFNTQDIQQYVEHH